MPLDAILAGSQQTLWLAPLVGAYLCVSSIGLVRPGESERFASDLHDHPASVHSVGAAAFFIGGGLLALHRHWATPPELAINLIAIWWTFEGAGMLLDPARLRALFGSAVVAKQLRITSFVSIPVGVYLLLVGFIGRPT